MIVGVAAVGSRYVAVVVRGRVAVSVVDQQEQIVHDLGSVEVWQKLLRVSRVHIGGAVRTAKVVVLLDPARFEQLGGVLRDAVRGADAEVLDVQLVAGTGGLVEELTRAVQAQAGPIAVARPAVGDTRSTRSWTLAELSQQRRTTDRLCTDAVQDLPRIFTMISKDVGQRCVSPKHYDRSAAFFHQAVRRYQARYPLARAVRLILGTAVVVVEIGAAVAVAVTLSPSLPGIWWGPAALVVLGIVLLPYAKPPSDRGDRPLVSVVLAVLALIGFTLEAGMRMLLPIVAAGGGPASIVLGLYLLGVSGRLRDVGTLLSVSGTAALVAVQLSQALRRHWRSAVGYVMSWYRQCEMICELALAIRLVQDLLAVAEHQEPRMYLVAEKLARLVRLHRLEVRRSVTHARRNRLRRSIRTLIQLEMQIRDGEHESGQNAHTELRTLLISTLTRTTTEVQEQAETARQHARRRWSRLGLGVAAACGVSGMLLLAPSLGLSLVQVLYALGAGMAVYSAVTRRRRAGGISAPPATLRKVLGLLRRWSERPSRAADSAPADSPSAGSAGHDPGDEVSDAPHRTA